jgi:hypothetical protein
VGFFPLCSFLLGVFHYLSCENRFSIYVRTFEKTKSLRVIYHSSLEVDEIMKVLMMWHAFLFLGLTFSPLFLFLLGGLRCIFL